MSDTITNIASKNECVILLHGLARTAKSFTTMEHVLQKNGYQTVNVSYPSTKFKIEKLAADAIGQALLHCETHSKVHFVTHSMGGILVRQYLKHHQIANLGRVVMIGPPNQGSEVVDSLRNVPGFKLINGPAGMQLGTENTSIPNQLGVATFETGVIAGNRSINLLLSTILPGPNDGKVTVENTRLSGMRDHITLPVTHPFMMKNTLVIKQTLHFLQYGQFQY